MVNNTVYFSTVYAPDNHAYGLNAVSGKPEFYFHDGAYTTVVAQPNAIYVMGRYVLYKFVPKK